MKARYKFVGRHGKDQYMWEVWWNHVLIGRYVAMIGRFWSGEPLPNAYFPEYTSGTSSVSSSSMKTIYR